MTVKELEEGRHMKRLTIPDEKTEGGWKRVVIDPGEVKKYAMTLYWTLKKYEDTGLTPDEINALRERDTAKEPEVNTNSDEIRVGSLVIGKGVKVYSCPKCGNMIRKSDNCCPECGQRLKLATAAQRSEWQDRMLHAFLGGHA